MFTITFGREKSRELSASEEFLNRFIGNYLPATTTKEMFNKVFVKEIEIVMSCPDEWRSKVLNVRLVTIPTDLQEMFEKLLSYYGAKVTLSPNYDSPNYYAVAIKITR